MPVSRTILTSSVLLLLSVVALPLSAQQRPMTFMDVQEMNRAGSWTPSPDGAWMLYTVSTPDWAEAESYSDIHLVSTSEGVSSSRQLTFSADKNERSPAWAPDGSSFAFISDRDGEGDAKNQIYVMKHDGGEAQKITDMEDGVSDFQFSSDGKWIVFSSGEDGREQLHRLSTADHGEPTQITSGDAGVENWEF